MRIVVIGAGPAGLTSAKQAIGAGHHVTLFEQHGSLGGIWNPASGGAYGSVRMQSSRLSYPFSDFPPVADAAFPTLNEVHAYLRAYADRFGVTDRIRFDARVEHVEKVDGEWHVRARTPHGWTDAQADAVMVATGELWEPVVPDLPAAPGCDILTAKDYRQPFPFAGRRVLVVGGGVSGADIASEVSAVARSVDWSIRRKALFLPRMCAQAFNDELFSYAGRLAAEALNYPDYLDLLARLMPDHMAACAEAGLLPEDGFHGAVHVNDAIVPLVRAGHVVPVPAFHRFGPDGGVVLADGAARRYDAVILCLGYRMARYPFLRGFRHERLFRHFIDADDPTLAIVNTPVDTEAFGTACPYFEAIAAWVLKAFAGDLTLPPRAEMLNWCAVHMGDLLNRRYHDCWLETIRLRLEAGLLPDPETDFRGYWDIVSGPVAPARLVDPAPVPPPALDAQVDVASVKVRLLAGLSPAGRARALAGGGATPTELARAAAVPPADALSPALPYRMRRHAAAAPLPVAA